jgi:hypothetical protein
MIIPRVLIPISSAEEKENRAGFEKTVTNRTIIIDLRISMMRSLILDRFVYSPFDARRNSIEENLFLIPLFLEIRCAIMGRPIAIIPIRK